MGVVECLSELIRRGGEGPPANMVYVSPGWVGSLRMGTADQSCEFNVCCVTNYFFKKVSPSPFKRITLF